MKTGSLRLRLLVAGAVSVLAALALSGFGLTLLFERHVERRIAAELGIHLHLIAAGIERSADGSLTVRRGLVDPRFAQPLSGLYWQVETGEALLRSRSLWDTELSLPPDQSADGAVKTHHIAGPGGRNLIAVERSVILPEHLGGGRIRAAVALNAAEAVTARRAFTADLLPYLSLLALFLIAAAYAQVAVGLKPLGDVRKRLAAIREGKARRLSDGFPSEILPLSIEVDALLEAREKQLERARERSADLAHGLKTPLQALSGDVERLRRRGQADMATEIEQVADTMRRHVDRELARARMGTGSPDVHAQIADVVERVVAVVARTPAGTGLDWVVNVAAEARARIDPDDLAEAIGNLVENAARHARGKVAIYTRHEAGYIIVTVADDGPGIPKERLEEALLRGGRLDRSGSAGIGLAIVRDIAEAWGGQFQIRADNRGLEAEFGIRA